MDGTAMSERPRYVTEIRRGREQRYRRSIARASAAAVVLHALLIPVAAPLTEHIPLVRRSGYRGEIRLLPEISVLREPAEVKSDVEAWANELTEAVFEVVNLSVTELELSDERPTQAVVEELDLTVGNELRDLLETSLPQPRGREIVIEHFVEPVYPQSAIDAGIEGVAVFGIQVAATGEVLRAWLVDSDVGGDCNIEAQRALLQWRFAPYLVDGRPSSFVKYYRIRFHFRDELRDGRRERLESGNFSRP
jgi:TonB family protein